MTSRRSVPAASNAGARARGAHSVAPEHLGEATAAATVAVMVGGVALVITGIGIIALALTLGARYGGDPPPNVGEMVAAPVAGGLLVLVLGGGLTAGGLAVLGAVRRARLATGILSAFAAGLGAIATVLVMANPPADPVLAIALTVATMVFGVASLLLLRPHR
jgi:hypothetical protein